MNFYNIIKKHPLISYFILTFIVSWSGIIFISIFTGMPAPSTTFASIAPLAMLPLVLGPTIVALYLSITLHGLSSVKRIMTKIIKWKLNIKWYLFAGLTLPVLASIVLLILSQFSSDYLPNIITTENRIQLILTALAVGWFLTLFEEIGWTGFALPKLRKHYSMLTSGLILGIIWGAWHFLPVFFGSGDSKGSLNFKLLYPGLFFHYAGLIPFRIILIWLYEKTKSLLLPWIMHMTLTTSTFFIFNISKTGLPLFIYYLFLATCLWIIVLSILLKNQSRRSYIMKVLNV